MWKSESEIVYATGQFLASSLTSRERILVAALALGFRQVDVASAWRVSAASVTQMVARIRRKADLFWANR